MNWLAFWTTLLVCGGFVFYVAGGSFLTARIASRYGNGPSVVFMGAWVSVFAAIAMGLAL